VKFPNSNIAIDFAESSLMLKKYVEILYLKFKLFNEKTASVPRDSVIFYSISLKFMISQSSVGYYNIPRQIHRGIL
jgi:hypothetical protein